MIRHAGEMIAGVAPREIVRPESIDELAEIVRDTYAREKAFALVGGGTELGLGNRPRALDTVIRTSALDRVVEYAPEDQTITVEAGITFAELDRVLGAKGQMFPLDVADRHAATLGGTVAANISGRRRQRYGTAKDLIVGVTIVRPDGTRARGGGKVVKNVAGFDLPKLMVGSLGTLGAIATVTVRVYPIPEATAAVAVHGTAETLAELCRALVARRLEPESVALYNGDTLVVTVSGTKPGVDAQTETLRALVPGAAVLTDLERESYEQREAAVRRDGAWRLRIAATPARAFEACATPLPGATADAVPVVYPLVGLGFHAYADASANAVEAARRDRAVVIHAMPDDVRDTLDAWGPPPPSFALMRALKERFDPRGLCNPGRFVGGL